MTRRGVAASGAIGFGGAVAGALLGLVLIAVVGRGLGVSETGVFFQVVALFMLGAALLRFGADTGLLRTWAVQSALAPTGMRQTLWIAVAPVALVSVAAALALQVWTDPLVARLHTADPDAAATMVRFLAWCLPAAVVGMVLLAGLRGLDGVVAFSVLQNMVLPALRVLGVLGVLAVGLNSVPAVMTAWGAALPVVLVVAAVLVARRLPDEVEPPPDTQRVGFSAAARRFWSFSVARGAAAFLETTLDWIDVLIVAALTSTAQAAVYGVATRLVRAGLVVDSAVRIAVAPQIAILLEQGDRATTSRLFTAMAKVVILLAWPAYLCLMVFGTTVLGWFGDGFSDGAAVLVVLSGAMMLTLAAGVVQSMLLMGGRSHYQLANKSVAVVVNTGLNLWLVPIHGIEGAAWAWVATLAVDTTLAAVQVRYRIGVALRLRTLVLPALLPLLVMGLGALGVRQTVGQSTGGLAVALVVIGAAYLAIVWRLRERLGLREVLTL